jgi:hypothetical protein
MSQAQLQALKDKINERQKASRVARLAKMADVEREQYLAKVNAENKFRRDAVKEAAYAAYGGYRCACCGETEKLFLSIDHVNNDGYAHRRDNNIQCGEQLYRWLARNKFPSGFQILCMNCQWGKRNNKGVCPHQVRCNDYPERE